MKPQYRANMNNASDVHKTVAAPVRPMQKGATGALPGRLRALDWQRTLLLHGIAPPDVQSAEAALSLTL